jgi:signal transduction histidine kinase
MELILIEKNEEIATQNEELSQTNQELFTAKEEVENSNEKLLQLNADKDRFISILAHDLKSPFNSILGFLSLLTKNIHKYDIEKIEKQLNIINNSAQNTFKLLEDILMWVRANSGKIPFEPQNLSIGTICNEVIENLKLTANAKNITINHLATDEITVFADKNMLNTVLRNLVSNSIKFTNKNGRIDICAEKTNINVIITVSDNGIGIEPDTLNKLFNISQKISTVGTESEKGTGLGLALCKEFVEKHSGKIWVESELGIGSDFKFTMPLFVDSEV